MVPSQTVEYRTDSTPREITVITSVFFVQVFEELNNFFSVFSIFCDANPTEVWVSKWFNGTVSHGGVWRQNPGQKRQLEAV